MPITILKAKTMCAIDKYEYYYVQTQKSIMRDDEKQRQRIEDILDNYDNQMYQVNRLKVDKYTNENFKIFLTNSLLVILPELSEDNKEYFKNELKQRKVSKYIKTRNCKQFVKKMLLKIKGL